MLNLYDTATSQIRPLKQRVPGELSIYLCGPTVYGPPHIGHGRATLVYDILRRYLEWTGVKVRLVSNITDIDDKIIRRAVENNEPISALTQRMIQATDEDAHALGVLPPASRAACHTVCARNARAYSKAPGQGPCLPRPRQLGPAW